MAAEPTDFTVRFTPSEEEVSSRRQYDIIVFGSTGFTGQFVNEELYRLQSEGRPNLKWAAAGRKQSKLESCLRGV